MKKILLLIILSTLIVGTFYLYRNKTTVKSDPNDPWSFEHENGTLVIGFKEGTTDEEIKQFFESAQQKYKIERQAGNYKWGKIMGVPEDKIREFAKEYQQSSIIKYVEPNFILHTN